MPSSSNFTIEGALKALWGTRGGMRKSDAAGIDGAVGNDVALRAQAASKLLNAEHEIFRVDADNDVRWDGSVKRPCLQPIPVNILTNISQHFFIAPFAMKIKAIQAVHKTAETTAATLTGYVEKLASGQASGTGQSMMTGTFNLKGTADTVQTATITPNRAYLSLAAGDRVGIVFNTTATELAGLVLTLWAEPGCKKGLAVFHLNANSALADQAFFVANRPGIITSVQYVHSVKGTNGSAVNLQVTKDTSTNAPGAGTDILTNNTNAGFDCKGAINTVQTGTLTATAATLRFAAGDRLAVDFAGTLTALVGVVVVVGYTAFDNSIDVTYNVAANGSLVDKSFFIANRAFLVRALRAVPATAGTDASAVSLQVTADKATDAPGAGVDLLATAFDMKGTASTVQIGTYADEGLRVLLSGDRLAVDYAGVLTTLAGVVVTATLDAI